MVDSTDLVLRVDGDLEEVRRNIATTRQELERASRAGRGFGTSLTRAFSDVALRGRKLSDVMKGLALTLSRNALKAAVRPLGGALAGGFRGILGNALGFSAGARIGSGRPVPFAHGGVLSSPLAFPLAGGRLGLAGEAGPEAIMPLARGPDGRLGVRAQAQTAPVSITFNVTTPDADSFRRSESQIAAMLSRTVSRGNRNL
ncbi:MAG: phage tail tape measure protein [Methyloligellaceae bacterium]